MFELPGRGDVRAGRSVSPRLPDGLDPVHPAGARRRAAPASSSPRQPAASAAPGSRSRGRSAPRSSARSARSEKLDHVRAARRGRPSRTSEIGELEPFDVDARPGGRRALRDVASSCCARSARSSGSGSRAGRGSRSTRRSSSGGTRRVGGLLPRPLHEAPPRRRPRCRASSCSSCGRRARSRPSVGRDLPARARRTTRSARGRAPLDRQGRARAVSAGRALVTGGASGIGAAIVERLAG